jgi:hypothetical protein
LAFLGFIGDNSLTDIKSASKCRQRTEDEQLEDNETVMNPVSLTVSDVIEHLTRPYPPRKSQERHIRDGALKKVYDL